MKPVIEKIARIIVGCVNVCRKSVICLDLRRGGFAVALPLRVIVSPIRARIGGNEIYW